jgi:hypothetical protein
VCVRRDRGVELIDLTPPRRVRTVAPLAGDVVQSAGHDDASGMLVVGGWGKVELSVVHGDGSRDAVAEVPISVGRVDWVDYAAGRLAALGQDGLVRVWTLNRRLDYVAAADHVALSPDGRYLASVTGRATRVTLRDLEARTTIAIDDLTDKPSLIRFVDGGRALVLGDHDGRVVIRPRADRGFAGPLVAAEVAG